MAVPRSRPDPPDVLLESLEPLDTDAPCFDATAELPLEANAQITGNPAANSRSRTATRAADATAATVLGATPGASNGHTPGASGSERNAAGRERRIHDADAPLGWLRSDKHRYRVLQRLGKGGFGSVFAARCLDPDPNGAPPHVAIKVLERQRSAQMESSLRRELAALLAIRGRDDRIPTLFDWQLEGDRPFVVMEYYPAGSLADAWPFMKRGDEETAWRLIVDLLAALAAAHRHGILHLDVKPSNVLLDGNGGFVLADFGVAQASRMSKGLLHQGQLAVGLGTHGYRAPEQDSMTIQSFDMRTDLWGVGATAWALYTGIDLNKRQDVLRKKEDGNVFGLPRLSDVALSCPVPLEEVIMSLLFIDPERRPGGASEVLAQVKAIGQGFGFDSQTVAAARRSNADPKEVKSVISGLVDPLWSSICRSPGFERYFVKFEDGEEIASESNGAYHTVLLLQGEVGIEREGELLDVESQEGAMLGMISTLTGAMREATLRARGTVWTCIFNEAELEQLVTCNSSVAVRMVRMLARRVAIAPVRLFD